MGVHTFEELLDHVGHDVHVSQYVAFSEDGTMSVANVAVECETCYTVLMDFDNEQREIKVCRTCGSENLMQDAFVNLNDADDVRTFDHVLCDDCGAENAYVIKNGE